MMIQDAESYTSCSSVEETANQRLLHYITRDCYRPAANIAGLVALLESEGLQSSDGEVILSYLVTESKKLLTLCKAAATV